MVGDSLFNLDFGFRTMCARSLYAIITQLLGASREAMVESGVDKNGAVFSYYGWVILVYIPSCFF